MTTEIKICGLTKPEEAVLINEAKANYAGFVFYSQSKRNVSLAQAEKIRKELSPQIRAVAVTVSPTEELLEQITKAEFDILQVHGELRNEILEQSRIPIWRACNLEQPEDLKHLEQHEKITGYVIDAKTAGSGKTFDWKSSKSLLKEAQDTYFQGKKFILAGGLNAENVAEGIKIFAPDIVDVSSGVESKNQKEQKLIRAFIGKVKEHE